MEKELYGLIKEKRTAYKLWSENKSELCASYLLPDSKKNISDRLNLKLADIRLKKDLDSLKQKIKDFRNNR